MSIFKQKMPYRNSITMLNMCAGWMREGSLKGIKIGRTWLVQRQSLEDYLKRTTEMSKHDPRRTQEKNRPN